jgi:hypothetical protein
MKTLFTILAIIVTVILNVIAYGLWRNFTPAAIWNVSAVCAGANVMMITALWDIWHEEEEK